MPDTLRDSFDNSPFLRFKEIAISEDWFKAYQVNDNLFIFREPRHYEETLINLIIGKEKAILIDTA